jgi:hypothetical protein
MLGQRGLVLAQLGLNERKWSAVMRQQKQGDGAIIKMTDYDATHTSGHPYVHFLQAQ